MKNRLKMSFVGGIFVLMSLTYAQPHYVLGHGISFSSGTGSTSVAALEKMLKWDGNAATGGAGSAANGGQVLNQSFGFGNLDSQGLYLKNRIAQLPKDKSDIILVAHSMGGLRARSYLQKVVDPDNKDRVKGLITFNSPHYGAPLATQASGFLARISLDAAIAYWGMGDLLMTAGYYAFWDNIYRIALSPMSDGTSEDLRPGSAFMNGINNPGNAPCTWVLQPVWVSYLWWGFWTTQWQQVCQSWQPDVNWVANKIPDQVKAVSIVGTNSHPRDMFPTVLNTSLDIFKLMHTWYTVSLASMVWWNWGLIPSLIAATDLTYVLWDFENVWNGSVVGDYDSDAFIPGPSQFLYSSGHGVSLDPNNRWIRDGAATRLGGKVEGDPLAQRIPRYYTHVQLENQRVGTALRDAQELLGVAKANINFDLSP